MCSEENSALPRQDVVALDPNYVALLDVLADAVLLIEADTGRILDANVEALRTFGYSIAEMRQLRASDLSADDDGGGSMAAGFGDALCGIAKPFDWQSQHKDGRLLWVDVHARGVRLGERACVLALLRDITARKTMETRLRIVHEALDDCGSAVLIADLSRSVIYLNASFGLLFGYVEGEKGEITLVALFADEPLGEEIVRGVTEGGEWNGEVRMRSRVHGEFPAFVRATPVLSENYDIEYIMFILNDITERKQFEAQLFQSQNMKAIGQLAAGIAHEINTPTQYVGDNLHFLRESFSQIFNALDLCAEMAQAARQGTVQAAQWEEFDQQVALADIPYLRDEVPLALRQSIEGVSRVSEIVRAMRQFTRAGVGERKTTDLNTAIVNTIAVAHNEWRFVADLETQLDPQLPPVPCFPGEINQVFLNLVVNAAHAVADVVCPAGSASGCPEVKGRIVVSTHWDGDYVEVRVSDTGTGIPEDIRDRIFDPFFTTKEVGKGTGQGLAICHDVVVEKHKGTLTFTTEVGKGTTFIVRLPLEDAPLP